MSKQGSRAKLHHYVPQGYLRGFANEKERITVVPLDGRPSYTPSVKNVAAQTNFHTLHGHYEPDEFEKLLSGIEGEALKIVRRLEGGELPLPERDRWTFSFYIALQASRGPDTRKTIEHLHAKTVRVEVGAGGRRNVKRWIKENMGFDASDEQANRIWDVATQPGGPPIVFPNHVHIQHMVDTAEQLTPYIATRPWTLVRFAQRSLITSDAPISLVRNFEDEPWHGVGFGTAWGVLFPLTRKLGLLMCDPMAIVKGLSPDDSQVQEIRAAVLQGAADRAQAGSTAMERLFNDHTAEHAREYLYRHPDDDKYVPAELHAPTLINMTAGGFMDAEFDGEPWFNRSEGEPRHHS